MSEQSPNPRDSSVFSRAKGKYDGWSRWVQIATIASPVAVVIAAILPIELTSHPGAGRPSPGDHISLSSSTPVASTPAPPTPGPSISSVSSPAAAATGQAGIPSGDLGTWGGQVAQSNGITDRFFLNLNQSGTPGSSNAVGTFNNQTGDCQGNVFLDGVSGGTLVALRLETTQNPEGDCVPSAEADVELAQSGTALDYEIVTAGTSQGTLQSPLAEGSLFH
jgi:hypothetical protein